MYNYIIFEGCDYTGKTTMAKAFVKKLKSHITSNVIYTKEPGSQLSKACIDIRSLIINATTIKHPETYSYLFAADTFEHMNSVVMPALNELSIVVSDRSVVSDFAYRPNVNLSIRENNLKTVLDLKPLVIWCRSSMETIQERFAIRQDTNDFESQHVMHNIKQIDVAYHWFFDKHRELDMQMFINKNDDFYEMDRVIDKLVKRFI